MAIVETEPVRKGSAAQMAITETRHEKWARWPVNWTAVWVGALAAISVGVIVALVGIALGAQQLGPEHRIVDLHKLGIAALIFSVFGAFLSFAAGGWIAGKIAGILHAEPAMLLGAIVWLVAVPMLVIASALGAGSLVGGWYGGIGSPSWSSANAPFARPEPIATGTADDIAAFNAQRAEYARNIKQWNEDTPKATRNSALGAVTALLLGLAGSVIGGWMACGEPMNLTHYRTRKPLYYMP
jgi:hypothetical protein